MEQNKFRLSSFIYINELGDSFALFNEKYSDTFVIENAFRWIIDTLKTEQLSSLELFALQQTKSLNYEEIISVVEQFVASKILVKVS